MPGNNSRGTIGVLRPLGSHRNIQPLTGTVGLDSACGMARPLRIERAGGWYHVTGRGNERRPIYRDNRGREHFSELLAEMVARFGARVQAYLLMDNHYHLLLSAPELNLSQAMQWFQTSYSMWFNRKHGRVGSLFQGRFSAVVLEPGAFAHELSRYVHLNPVRLAVDSLRAFGGMGNERGLSYFSTSCGISLKASNSGSLWTKVAP